MKNKVLDMYIIILIILTFPMESAAHSTKTLSREELLAILAKDPNAKFFVVPVPVESSVTNSTEAPVTVPIETPVTGPIETP